MINRYDIRQLFVEQRYDVMALILAALFPAYRSFTSVVMLFLFAAAAVVLFMVRSKTEWHASKALRIRYFLISTAFYFVMILSMTYTSDQNTGILFLTANSYLLFYPLFMFLFVKDISGKHIAMIIVSFTIGCCLYAFYMHYYFFKEGLYSNFQGAEFNKMPFRDIMSLYRGHPTYMSMWFLFSCLALIYYFFTERFRWPTRLLMIAVIVFLIGSSVILSAKITIIAFVCALLVLIYKLVQNKLVVFVSYAALIAVFVVSIFQLSFLRARFIDEFQSTELKAPVGLHTNSLNIRVGILECSQKVFAANWIIGTGIGDSQAELDKCYMAFKTDVYKGEGYNTHNNYFAMAIAIGIVGLVLFLLMLGLHLRDSIILKNDLFLIFLVFVMVCMIPENILSRHAGVVFYSLFYCVFGMQNLHQRLSS